MSATGTLGVAGCQGDAEDPTETGSGTDGDDSDGTVDTATAGPPLRESLRLRVNKLPQDLNFNLWSTATTLGGVYGWVREIDQIQDLATERKFDDSSWDVNYRKSGTREFSVNHLIEDMEFPDKSENYTTVVFTFNQEDEFTYWDGTPIKPRAYYLHNLLNYHMRDDGRWANEEIKPHYGLMEEEGKLHYYWGGIPGVDADHPDTSGGNPPVNMRNWMSPMPPGGAPMHPDFTGEWIDRFESASSEEEHESIEEELINYNLGLEELVENDWGSGIYRIESTDEISSESITLTKRNDHPNADIVTVPEVELKTARSDRYRQLLREGEIDFAHGVVQEDAPPLDANVLPDHFQQVDTWYAPGTTMLYFNWQNPHVARQGVRRAIAAAVPWPNVRLNGWGEGLAAPIEDDTGMSNTANKKWFSDDFLDSLYKYPRESDTEQAAKWLREEGYQKDGDTWKYEDGTPLQISFVNNNDIDAWLGGAQTIRESLQAFGMEIQLDNIEGNAYIERLDNDDFGMAMANHGRDDVFSYYGAHGGGLATFLYADGPDFWRCEPDAETDVEDKPTEVTVPQEPGALEIEGDGETYNMCQHSRDLFAPDATKESVGEIAHKGARWYNYDLPHIHFAQTRSGYVGNVRDFDWPKSGQGVNALGSGSGPPQITTGIVRTAHDDSY